MVFPTTLFTAPRIGDLGPQHTTREISFFTGIARNITSGSTLSLPGLVLPCGLTPDRLPASLELDGPAGSDAALLAIGRTLESLLEPMPRP
jgi:indoleacetamide hydrolase